MNSGSVLNGADFSNTPEVQLRQMAECAPEVNCQAPNLLPRDYLLSIVDNTTLPGQQLKKMMNEAYQDYYRHVSSYLYMQHVREQMRARSVPSQQNLQEHCGTHLTSSAHLTSNINCDVSSVYSTTGKVRVSSTLASSSTCFDVQTYAQSAMTSRGKRKRNVSTTNGHDLLPSAKRQHLHQTHENGVQQAKSYNKSLNNANTIPTVSTEYSCHEMDDFMRRRDGAVDTKDRNNIQMHQQRFSENHNEQGNEILEQLLESNRADSNTQLDRGHILMNQDGIETNPSQTDANKSAFLGYPCGDDNEECLVLKEEQEYTPEMDMRNSYQQLQFGISPHQHSKLDHIYSDYMKRVYGLSDPYCKNKAYMDGTQAAQFLPLLPSAYPSTNYTSNAYLPNAYPLSAFPPSPSEFLNPLNGEAYLTESSESDDDSCSFNSDGLTH